MNDLALMRSIHNIEGSYGGMTSIEEGEIPAKSTEGLLKTRAAVVQRVQAHRVTTPIGRHEATGRGIMLWRDEGCARNTRMTQLTRS